MSDDAFVEEYLGYKIWKNYVTVWVRNPVSGHRWPEDTPTKTFYVSGKGVPIYDTFFSVEKAKEKINSIIEKFGVLCD